MIKELYQRIHMSRFIFFLFGMVLFNRNVLADNGHDLWLPKKQTSMVTVVCSGRSPILATAVKELHENWKGANGASVRLVVKPNKSLKKDGFMLDGGTITSPTDKGILYGVYTLLRQQETGEEQQKIQENPSYDIRVLNHWDNPNGSVERGYAGKSIFWRGDDLTVTAADLHLWKEYARANASIGINATVLNNVNASPLILTVPYLMRIKAIADVLRPYGLRVYLSVNFSSPVLLGKLKTADPLDADVRAWWKQKTKEIYAIVPDFGGYLVKASSEGQPGPQDFGRSHAVGANMLADVVKPYNGYVMWRAFVYNTSDIDRAKQAYNEFINLDGTFRKNVILQVKNGPIDFQPREPFSPLFGAMKNTCVMPEVQITQEYLGHAIHLVYLAPMWEEFLQEDTFQQGAGSTVARMTDGRAFSYPVSAISGVANIGLDSNWTGHLFAQANWYAFGRLAWNNSLGSKQIADEWLRLTFYGQLSEKRFVDNGEWETSFLEPVKLMMLKSREAAVNYMTPLGLHHIMAAHHHYGPGPWWSPVGMREDWTPPYYHRAAKDGIGFDRSRSGTNAVGQYAEPLATIYNDPVLCPENLLLWFHHLPWTYKMKSGNSLWVELCLHYEQGVNAVRDFQKVWDRMERYIDAERFKEVQYKLRDQSKNAVLWRDGCLLYFQRYSQEPIPFELERPVNKLEEMMTYEPKENEW